MINKEKETMQIKITGDRGKNIDRSVLVEVVENFTTEDRYCVRHVDGKLAFLNKNGGDYSRMNGCKYTTIMKYCEVEIV